MKSWLGGTLDKLYPYWGPVHHSGRGERLPKFPWPPPAGFKTQFISDSVLGRRPKTLGEVYDLLTSTLSRVDGFEWGLFGNVPGGFALLARMERIRQDGSPYPGQSRWATDGTPLLSFKDFLAHMFLDPPGYFRVIAFVVTDDVNFDSAALASLPGIGAGERSMPDDLRAVPFDTDRKLLALVYSYERKPGARISPLEASWAPNAQQHLKAAGILAAFAQP
jgi:hypothetical protein